MSLCECATVAYYPNDFNDEHINIAFLLHDIEKGRLLRSFITKRQRIKEFDDRLNDAKIDLLFDVLKSSLDDTFPESNQLSLLSRGRFDSYINREGFFKELGKNFLNSVRFVDCFSATPTDVQRFFEDNVSLALYFDQDKEKRPDAYRVTKIMRDRIRDIFKELGIEEIKTCVVSGERTFGESIRMDGVYKGTYYKLIDPLSGTREQKIKLAKEWAFNISQYFPNRKEEGVVLVVPDSWNSAHKEEQSETFNRILKTASAKVLSLSEFAKRIMEKQA